MLLPSDNGLHSARNVITLGVERRPACYENYSPRRDASRATHWTSLPQSRVCGFNQFDPFGTPKGDIFVRRENTSNGSGSQTRRLDLRNAGAEEPSSRVGTSRRENNVVGRLLDQQGQNKQLDTTEEGHER